MNDLQVSNSTFQITSFEQAERFATMYANSDFATKDFKGKPANVLIALTLGNELGIKPMQAVQNISVVGGRACVWGDLALALVRANPECHGVKEWIEGSVKDGTATAYCEVTRNAEVIKDTFSMEMAKRAGLWGKPGPWVQYPERMLTMRARGFALRNSFPDALKGLYIREEMEGSDLKYQAKQMKQVNTVDSKTLETYEFVKNEEEIVYTENNFAELIEKAKTTEELKAVGLSISEAILKDDEISLLKKIYKERLEILKDDEELQAMEFPVKE